VAPGGSAEDAAVQGAAEVKGQRVAPVLWRPAVVEKRHHGVGEGHGQEKGKGPKQHQPQVAGDDDEEEVSRKVEPEERDPRVGVAVDGRLHEESAS
jgi:hypothetical protein